MNIATTKAKCTFCAGTNESDNPYDKRTQPKEHAAWHDAFWAVWLECKPYGDVALREEAPAAKPEQHEFALLWEPRQYPFRLRVNDLLRVDGRIARVIRVTECAAVLLVNQSVREFKTRFDKPVRFQPSPKITRISANSECEILYRKTERRGKSKGNERRPS